MPAIFIWSTSRESMNSACKDSRKLSSNLIINDELNFNFCEDLFIFIVSSCQLGQHVRDPLAIFVSQSFCVCPDDTDFNVVR